MLTPDAVKSDCIAFFSDAYAVLRDEVKGLFDRTGLSSLIESCYLVVRRYSRKECVDCCTSYLRRKGIAYPERSNVA